MRKPDVMKDEEIRATLRSFVAEAARQVRPAPLDRADTLVKMLSMESSFLEVRNAIANTKVEIARCHRPGSSTRSKLSQLETRLRELNAERQRIVSTTAQGDGFVEARKREIEQFNVRMEEWERTRSIVVRIQAVLERPRLPGVVRPQPPSVLALVEAVESHVDALPRPGSLILMGMEPRPQGADFRPIHAGETGLNPKMFTGSIRLTASPGSPAGDRAEVAGAVVARDSLVMVIGQDRRPVDLSAWDRLEPFLPRATRKSMLPIVPSCMPHSSPYGALNRLLSTESWRSIRDSANDRNNSTCVVCGQNASGVVKPEWEFIEPLRARAAYGIQRLVDVNSYCSQCAGVVFPMPGDLVALAAGYSGHERDQVYVINPKMSRLSRLNRWSEDAYPDPLAEAVSIARAAYQRRSRVRWALDLAVLHGQNLVLNPEMAMHPKGVVMRREDLGSFDDNRSVHLTRIFNASFATESGQLHFFELPPVHEAPWDTSFEAFSGTETSSSVPVDAGDVSYDEPAGPADPDDEDVLVEEGLPFSVAV